ncbi:MAG: hypothetical protein MZV64_70520 [Ignavibacteriales bacterium]|nr:hypothetical protein [Ignavibacteriales bacterium]
MFYTIRRHYVETVSPARCVRLHRPPKIGRHPVVVLVGGMHRGVIAALTYARAISPNVTAHRRWISIPRARRAPPDALARVGAGRSPGGARLAVPVRSSSPSSNTSTRWKSSGTAIT